MVGGGQGWNQDSRLGMGVCFGWCLLGILKSASDRLNPHACLGVCLNPSALGVTLYAPLCPMSPPPGWLERPRGCLQTSTLGRAGEPAAATCGEAPPAPSAGRSPRSRCQPRAPSQRASQRGSGGGGGGGGPRAAGRGRRRGEGGRKGSREGGREERRTQRAPGSWSFCSAWPGFNAQQQRAAAAAGSPGAPAAAEPAAAPLPAPCKLCEPPARGAGGAPGKLGLDHSRALGRRSASRRRRCYHRISAPPRGEVGGSPGPQPRPLGTARLVPGQGWGQQRRVRPWAARRWTPLPREVSRGWESAPRRVPNALAAAPGQRPDPASMGGAE